MPWKLSRDSRVSARAHERQMNNWELARLQRLERPPARAEVEDFVTISRQVGIPAERVGQALGTHFGWPVFGRSLLEAMAGDSKVRHRIYRSMDERDLHWWEEAFRALLEQEFNVNDYFHRLTHTVLSLVRQSPCILVGRGCDLILPRHLGPRVRLVSPLEPRIATVAEEHSLTRDQAIREMDRIEAERIEYLHHHFGARVDDPARSDLVINLGRWDADGAIELILAALAKRPERPVAAAS